MYVTPVVGDFCNCPLDTKNTRLNYIGNVYFPLGNVSFDSSYDIDKVSVYDLQKKVNLNHF